MGTVEVNSGKTNPTHIKCRRCNQRRVVQEVFYQIFIERSLSWQRPICKNCASPARTNKERVEIFDPKNPKNPEPRIPVVSPAPEPAANPNLDPFSFPDPFVDPDRDGQVIHGIVVEPTEGEKAIEDAFDVSEKALEGAPTDDPLAITPADLEGANFLTQQLPRAADTLPIHPPVVPELDDAERVTAEEVEGFLTQQLPGGPRPDLDDLKEVFGSGGFNVVEGADEVRAEIKRQAEVPEPDEDSSA